MTKPNETLAGLVRPLVWSDQYEPACIALTDIGIYAIVWRLGSDDFSDDEASFQLDDGKVEGADWFDGPDALESAKAAAQADYATRTLSALDTDKIVALVEAAQRKDPAQ